jgi:DNA-binding MarR family transcriptional regulator
MKTKQGPDDSIARVRAQWRAASPELETEPMEVIGRILRLEFFAREKIRKALQPFGVDLGGSDVLATLRRSGPPFRLTPTALYRELMLTSGAMTNRLDVLEKAGLVERQQDPGDRRGTLIELTKKGRALIDRVMQSHMENEAQMIAHLSRAEQRSLAQLLNKLLKGMEEQK